jgi:hypothetical protein
LIISFSYYLRVLPEHYGWGNVRVTSRPSEDNLNNLSNLTLAFWGTLAVSVASIPALAQPRATTTPCGTTFNNHQPTAAQGLTSVAGGAIIYDANQDVCWLADANLAGDPQIRAAVKLSPQNPDGSTPVINPDGTMNYQTALNWVAALNNYNGGKGWLNQNTWQLPTNPSVDPTCTSSNTDNFGAQCTGSGMGNLYGVGLARTYPDSVAPVFIDFVWPFFNLHPGLYWTSDSDPVAGEVTFSFNTGLHGANTTKYNFLHVLPVTSSVLGPLPRGRGVNFYLGGPGAGRAVYDSNTGLSWTLDANLPARDNFGVTATTTVTADSVTPPNPDTNGGTLTLPMINPDGTIYFDAVDPNSKTPGWISAMNAAKYAGASTWALPSEAQIAQLYTDMGISVGDNRLEWPFPTGPFSRLQPAFYWACPSGNDGACDLTQNAPPDSHYTGNMEWSFNFDDGFEGTDQDDKMFYVMVYYPIQQGCGDFC